MKINKDYMNIMRSGKLSLSSVKKQNNSGIIVGICMILACITIVCGILIK